MRILIIIFCAYLLVQSSPENKFEGTLVYHHDMKMNAKDYSEFRKFYDTLTISYKNKSYIKQTNKARYEKILFLDSLKKIYTIYDDNLSRSKKLSMNEDNLNFGKLYTRENSHFGTILSASTSDTIFSFNNKEHALKKLLVKRKYGKETFVFSKSEDFKLAGNRNLLRNMGEQVHPNEIATEVNNAILYYYKLKVKNLDISEEFRLVDIRHKKLNQLTFEIPKHKDAKGFKRENKKKGRFKFYELID